MKCQRCKSERVLFCHAHGRDCQVYQIGNQEHQGYAPHVSGICGGDDLKPVICLNCGQVQGTFPKPTIDLEES